MYLCCVCGIIQDVSYLLSQVCGSVLNREPEQHFKKSLDPGHKPAPDRVLELECHILQINTGYITYVKSILILYNLLLPKTVEELGTVILREK